MSGHSKWNNIKNKKASTDARKSKEFTVVAKMIMQAVKKSGITNPNENAALRLALEKARSLNMPNINIQRAIDRGSGKGESGISLEEIMYEGYGPHGVGILIEAHTDNHQRTAGELRFVFSHHGGALASPGSASYLFSKGESEYTPTIPILLDVSQYTQIMDLIEELEAHDDVDNVWHNARLQS